MSTSDSNTDDSQLVVTDTVYVSPDGGTTDEAFPKPDVEYDFCVDLTNAGQLPSGPFSVRFMLSGDQDPPKDLDPAQDVGLDTGASVKAVVHFGTFPNTFATYHLDACIYLLQRRRRRSIAPVRLILPSIRTEREARVKLNELTPKSDSVSAIFTIAGELFSSRSRCDTASAFRPIR
jgi:hypothetical protein